jgi:hypothetical protein
MKDWTQEEIDYLIEHQGKLTYKMIGNVLGRSEASVSNKAKRMGIADKRNCIRGRTWTEEELQYMRDNYGKVSIAQMRAHLKRKRNSIQEKAQRMGLTQPKKTESVPWTQKEINYLKRNYEKQGSDVIAAHLNRTVSGVRGKAQLLGCNAWITEKLYLKTIAKCFNCDPCGIHRWVDDLGLPASTLQRGQLTCTLISVDDFWKWAKTHKKVIPWEKYELSTLLPEPLWLPEVLQASKAKKNNRKRITKWDISTVVKMKQEGYTEKEIAAHMQRTISSVKHIWSQAKENGYGTNNR